MVTSHNMSENEMDNRGSKSVLINNTVKEQRVDGSWYIKSMYLRYTLMGFERNYQVKIPSNQINKASYSTLISQPKMNPWFFTGFSGAEACFSILIQHNVKFQTN
jgi:hypothetical protein